MRLAVELGPPDGLAVGLVGRLDQLGNPTFRYLGSGAPVSCDPPWQCAQLASLPPAVLVAAHFVAAPDRRGVETDLIARESDGGRYITARHEADGTISVQDAPIDARLLPEVAAAADPGALRGRFGIGALDAGRKRWSADEIRSLERTLLHLTPAELSKLEGIEFRREARVPEGTSVDHAGRYQFGMDSSGAQHWIEIFDSAFQNDAYAFVGPVSAPSRVSEQVILHEIGHAISMAPSYAMLVEVSDSMHRFEDTVASFNRLGRRIPLHEVPRFERVAPQIDRLNELFAKTELELRESLETGASSIVADFAGVRGAQPGITPYARTSVVESFAEAFSVCRLDREACERIAPELAAYFDAGRHLDTGSSPVEPLAHLRDR